MVDKAVAAGYPIVIVDNSPIGEIASLLRASGATVFAQQHKGMGPGRNQAFFHGTMLARELGYDVIVWMEPEKIGFVDCIASLLEQMELNGAGIVIPRRSEKSWESWPAFQRQSEEEANAAYNRIYQTEGFDPMFGPVLFRQEYAHHFVLCDPQRFGVANTYTQHYAPITAMREGVKVTSIEVDMTYPAEQKAEEEGALNEAMLQKRRDQRDTLIAAYEKIHYALSPVRDML